MFISFLIANTLILKLTFNSKPISMVVAGLKLLDFIMESKLNN